MTAFSVYIFLAESLYVSVIRKKKWIQNDLIRMFNVSSFIDYLFMSYKKSRPSPMLVSFLFSFSFSSLLSPINFHFVRFSPSFCNFIFDIKKKKRTRKVMGWKIREMNKNDFIFGWNLNIIVAYSIGWQAERISFHANYKFYMKGKRGTK